MDINHETLDHIFTYHAPKEDQPARYAATREAAKVFAKAILDNAGPNRERSAALTLVQQALHMANASIAING